MSAKDVLLAVSTSGFAEESASYAIERAASEPGAKLHVLLVCEPEGEKIAEKLSESSVGDKVGEQLLQALSRDRRTRGYRWLSGISRDAEAEEVPVETKVVEGELEPELRRYAEGKSFSEVVVSLPSPGFFSRFFSKQGDPASRIQRSFSIPVKVFRYE
ncbi:MAG: universal stress protein [Bdellovibrionota bacterium]